MSKPNKKPKTTKKNPKQYPGRERKQQQPSRASMPVSYAQALEGSRPTFYGGRDCIGIRHAEMVTIVTPTQDAWSIDYSTKLNPGNATLFPWLSANARNWESYSFKALKFVYKTRSSTIKDGVLHMFADYNVADQISDLAGLTETAASSMQGFQETPVYRNRDFICDVKAMQQSKPTKYVVPDTGVPAGADPANYYSGVFFTATSGNTTSLGSLWVVYDVMLYTPQPNYSLQLTPNYLSASSVSHPCDCPNGVFNDWFCTMDLDGTGDSIWRSNVVVEKSDGKNNDTLVVTQPGWYTVNWNSRFQNDAVAFADSGLPVITTVDNGLAVTLTENAFSERSKETLNTDFNIFDFGFNFLVEKIGEELDQAVKLIFNPKELDSKLIQNTVLDSLEFALSYLGPLLLTAVPAPAPVPKVLEIKERKTRIPLTTREEGHAHSTRPVAPPKEQGRVAATTPDEFVHVPRETSALRVSLPSSYLRK